MTDGPDLTPTPQDQLVALEPLTEMYMPRPNTPGPEAVDIMADALKKEFKFFNADAESWRVAARGVLSRCWASRGHVLTQASDAPFWKQESISPDQDVSTSQQPGTNSPGG